LTDITNPFWTTVARGAEDAASERGFNVILCNTDESEAKQAKYLQVLLQKQVDGILLAPVRSSAQPVELIQKQGTAVVVIDRQVPQARVEVVRGDSETGAYQLIRHLLELRHRRIAVLAGPADVSTAVDRVKGYQRAMAEAGLSRDASDLIYYGQFIQASGYEMMQQALAVRPRPTAVFATNNFIAVGALRALRDAGLQVPEEMALVSFDDLPEALVFDPFLTVAAQPGYEMGRLATTLLLDQLAGQSANMCQEHILPAEIIIRRSSGLPVNGQSCKERG
jgi:LacI family transcriptional regulator